MPGGKEIHVAELTRAQLALGHAVHLHYRFGGAPEPFTARQAASGRRPLSLIRGLPGTSIFALESAIHRRSIPGIDLVHVHGDFAEAAFMSRGPAKLRRPTVLTVHGQLNPRYNRLAVYAFRDVDAFVALGSRVADDLRLCRVDPRKIFTMSSGLNFELLDEHVMPETPGSVVIVGSLNAVKNVATVVRAFREVPASLAARLEVIGDGPDRQALERLAGGDSRIRFLGHMSREKVYERVAAASVFVIASRRLASKGEGVPTALLEAMALRRTCLVSVDALPGTAISDHASYRQFDPSRVDALTREITAALSDPRMRAELGTRAREAVSHLSWEQRALDMDRVYAAATRQHRRSA